MLNRIIVTVFFLCMACASLASAGDLINGAKPEQILAIVRGFGSAKLDKDKDGDPTIKCTVDDIKYAVVFYGCSDGKNCSSIQFVAGWSGKKVRLETINEWNSKKRFTKAYIDSDNDPMLVMDINLDYGVTEQNLEDSIKMWNRNVSKFKEKISD